MTAEVGGAVGGAGGVFGGFVFGEPVLPPEDDEDDEDDPPLLLDELGPPALNGSLLSKSENDCSCPVAAGALTESTSWVEPAVPGVAVVVVGSAPPSVGAAGSAPVGAGVGAADVVVAPAAATCGFAPPLELSPIIVCTAYAPAPASNTISPIAIFFCFSAFALAASATFLRATVFSSPTD
jgi:hypothetical protein